MILPTLVLMSLISSPETIPLWPEGLPGGWTIEGPEKSEREDDGVLRLLNISRPRLEAFPGGDKIPVIVVPGGGYWILAADHEGTQVAEWLVGKGHPAYVLIHRLPRPDRDMPRHAVPLEDLTKALAIVRERHPSKEVATVGFSAGAHLTAVAASGLVGPDRLALIYAAYLLDEKNPARLSSEVVPGRKIPVWGAVSEDDGDKPAGLRLYAQITGGETHFTPDGGHGYGLKPKGQPAPWLDALVRFLN